VIIVSDVLFVIEAKAGNLPMQSPATNFASHERVIQKLLVEAYRQCRRFLEYLASAPEVALYVRRNGAYVEDRRIRIGTFRVILPIGLTVETFSPFSATVKELPGLEPILGNHPFVSMSVDDLFVLRRFLPSTGELLHYLEVRQQVAGIPNAMLFDEFDHLGAYISINRFDLAIKEQLSKADQVTWDSFSDVVDHYFGEFEWQTKNIPTQDMPAKLAEVIAALDRCRPADWLMADSHLRNFSSEGRRDVAEHIKSLEHSLHTYPRRHFSMGGQNLLQVWLCRAGAEPSLQEPKDRAQASCLTMGTSKGLVLILSYRQSDRIGYVSCQTVPAPNILQNNYGELQQGNCSGPSGIGVRPGTVSGRLRWPGGQICG